MRHKMRNAVRLAVLLAVSVSVARAEDLVRWVDPLVGTVGEGNTFPGSCYPFGLVQASPDTGDRVTCSGYKHTDTTIRGFSQTHLNGTGRPAMGDLSLMPFVGDFDETGLASPFRKEPRRPVADGVSSCRLWFLNCLKREFRICSFGWI